MNVITIEETAYKNLLGEIQALMTETRKVNTELFVQRNKYLTSGDVAGITGYKPATIRLKKDEIGYISMGGEIKFLKADVDKWMMKYYIHSNI